MPGRVPPTDSQLRDLEVLIEAHHPILWIDSVEDDRISTMLSYLADRLGMPMLSWDPNSGLTRQGPDGGKPPGTETFDQCLAFIQQANLPGIFHMPGISDFGGEKTIARLKEIYRRYSKHPGVVVFNNVDVELPPGLDPLVTHVELSPPNMETYRAFVSALLREIGQRKRISIELDTGEVESLLHGLHGLSFFEVRKIITQAVLQDGKLSRKDLEQVMLAKRRIIERSGVLEYFPHSGDLDEIAGLTALKNWLRKRHNAFAEPKEAKEFGLTPPKGLMLIGVQGCGKSLCAKAVAAEWKLPLIRLDPSSLYQKYFGESERNLRRAVKTAEEMAPVVLWIDEIEKAFGQGSNDGGTSQRVLGTFLAWLQEKKESVFVIATANDISSLPPELLRKGRFDEIFFVDLPDESTRKDVFALHLRKRFRDPSLYDLAALAKAAEGFSGAEIEQAVVSALYAAFGEHDDINTEMLLAEIALTRPLSVTMAEQVQSLRNWAYERAVRAD